MPCTHWERSQLAFPFDLAASKLAAVSSAPAPRCWSKQACNGAQSCSVCIGPVCWETSHRLTSSGELARRSPTLQMWALGRVVCSVPYLQPWHTTVACSGLLRNPLDARKSRT